MTPRIVKNRLTEDNKRTKINSTINSDFLVFLHDSTDKPLFAKSVTSNTPFVEEEEMAVCLKYGKLH